MVLAESAAPWPPVMRVLNPPRARLPRAGSYHPPAFRRKILYTDVDRFSRRGDPCMVITRIAPLPAAKIAGLIYALIGLVFTLLIWFISLIGLNISGLSGSPFFPFAPGMLMAGGAMAVVVLSILNGVFGFLATLIAVALYNFMAVHVGGLSIEVGGQGSPV